MASDTVTVFLDGEPTLDDLVTALDALREMLNGLADSRAEEKINWTIDALEKSSALATFRGVAANPQDVTAVTERYIETAAKMLRGEAVPARVARASTRLLGILNGRVPSIRLETADDDVTISTPTSASTPAARAVSEQPSGSFGAIEGQIQTLSNRGGLRFTLYDLVRDKAVSCYLEVGQQELMRDAWGRFALVEGWIKREPATGRPLTIRRVRRVDFVEVRDRGEWRRAEGALKGVGRSEPAEDTIRRLRDGW